MNLTPNIHQLLSEFDLEDFIAKNKQISGSEYLLRYKGNKNKLNWYLAEQLNNYLKAPFKLPAFTQKYCWFTSKSYEQASSQATALYKSSHFSGKQCLDLSGGLGVDDWAFSQTFDQIISLDPDTELNAIVRINFQKLNINNFTRIDTTAEGYLESCVQEFDLIYLDADRRNLDKKSFKLDEGAPNFKEIEAKLHQLAKNILLKLSPLVDISYLIANIQNVYSIEVLSVEQEVKEILVWIKPGFNATPKISATDIFKNSSTLKFEGERNAKMSEIHLESAQYFYEPSAAIIKAGLTVDYAKSLQLQQIAPNAAFYLGTQLLPIFMGRAFEMKHCFEFSKSRLNQYLHFNNIEKAHINKRNFNMSVDEIRKSFKIKEGGDNYLFFCTQQNGLKWVYHCLKPKELRIEN